MKTFDKHPNANLDFGFALKRWLTGGELVTTVTAELISGDVVLGQELTDGLSIGVMIAGGTNHSQSVVTLRGETNSNPPRVFARTFVINVTDSVGQA